MSLDEIIARYMPSDESVRTMGDFFAVFSQETRLRLISLLSISPLPVNDIATLLHLNQTTVSHQLRILKDRRIVTTMRKGKEIIYSLANEGINDIMFQAVKITENRESVFAERLQNKSKVSW